MAHRDTGDVDHWQEADEVPVHSMDRRKVPARFRTLPERIDPEEMVTSQESQPVGDPEAGRDTNRDFMLRNC